MIEYFSTASPSGLFCKIVNSGLLGLAVFKKTIPEPVETQALQAGIPMSLRKTLLVAFLSSASMLNL